MCLDILSLKLFYTIDVYFKLCQIVSYIFCFPCLKLFDLLSNSLNPLSTCHYAYEIKYFTRLEQ